MILCTFNLQRPTGYDASLSVPGNIKLTRQLGNNMKATIDTKKNLLIIEATLEKPRPSSTGKTQLVVSERQKFPEVTVEGHPITIQLNAHIKP